MAIPTCAPSWPWPLITNGIRPARLRIHIRSSTARASATSRYISTRSASVSPTDAASAEASPVTAIGALGLRATPLVAAPVSATPFASEVDRPSVDGHRGLAHDLGERRMRVGRETDLPRGRLQREPETGLGDEVGGVRPDDVDAEGVAGGRVGDDLGEALVLAPDDRLGDRLERDLAHLVGRPGGLDLILGQPDRGDLRAAVDRKSVV